MMSRWRLREQMLDSAMRADGKVEEDAVTTTGGGEDDAKRCCRY